MSIKYSPTSTFVIIAEEAIKSYYMHVMGTLIIKTSLSVNLKFEIIFGPYLEIIEPYACIVSSCIDKTHMFRKLSRALFFDSKVLFSLGSDFHTLLFYINVKIS